MIQSQLLAVRSGRDGLELQWVPPVPTCCLPWLWLRDHCHAAESLRADTGQRQVDTFAINPAIRATRAEFDRVAGEVTIRWQGDAQTSRYPVAFLWQACSQPDRIGEAAPTLVPWDATGVPAPEVAYQAVMNDGADGLRDWLLNVARHGFGLVAGVPASAAATRALGERVAYIRHTIFGGFWQMEANLAHHDTGYTTEYLAPHTDATYSRDAPGLMLFHCLAFEGEGGDSVLVDGFEIARRMAAESPDLYNILTEVPVPGQYLEPGVHLRAERPVLRLNRHGDIAQVSFNNYDRAPFRLPDPDRMHLFYQAYRRFHALTHEPGLQWRQRLLPGTALLFDNWRLLHGRHSYSGHRKLAGAYFNREDFESRLRMLRAAASTPTSAGVTLRRNPIGALDPPACGCRPAAAARNTTHPPPAARQGLGL